MYAVYLALSWHIINAQESGSHPLLLTSLLRSVPAVTKEQILHPPSPDSPTPFSHLPLWSIPIGLTFGPPVALGLG